jgi:hypothetical protein
MANKLKSISIQVVQNGFILTDNDSDAADAPRQFVAGSIGQVCKILRREIEMPGATAEAEAQ